MNTLLQASGGAMGSSLLMMVAIIAVFYFFMIRPQQKKQKDVQKAREAMKAGDKVVTAGGIHGRIKEVSDNWFLVEIADGVKIKVEKTSVFASSADVGQN
mgnify:FL=1